MIRAAIVGLGTWGQNLVRSVQGSSPVIQFVAAATRTPEKSREFAQTHGLRMFPGCAAALADPEIDAVVLATPHSMHTEQIVAAAQAGKQVFSEKPLGLVNRFAGLRPYTPPADVFDIFRRELEAAFAEGGIFQLTMHPHISGYRSRIWILEELIRHAKSLGPVWFATHADVVRHVKANP